LVQLNVKNNHLFLLAHRRLSNWWEYHPHDFQINGIMKWRNALSIIYDC